MGFLVPSYTPNISDREMVFWARGGTNPGEESNGINWSLSRDLSLLLTSVKEYYSLLADLIVCRADLHPMEHLETG